MNQDIQHRTKRVKFDNNVRLLNSDQIAQLCFETYQRLGKSGKPDPNREYTVLACIVQHQKDSEPIVVALSTGTKCFPRNVPFKLEDIVDCHAEPLLKRAFKRYLLNSFEHWLDSNKDKLSLDQFYQNEIRPRQYSLFVSQIPCGCVSKWKGEETNDESTEFSRYYKTTGVNRKPGKGELCPKSGCIHKIAKWNIFGLQGSKLLSLVSYPITISRLIFGNCEAEADYFCKEEIVSRFTVKEIECETLLKQNIDTINQFDFQHANTISIEFARNFRPKEFVRSGGKLPTGSSIVAWFSFKQRFQCEILANGRKLGARKRNDSNRNDSKVMLQISDRCIHGDIEMLKMKIIDSINVNDNLQKSYDRCWNIIKRHVEIFKGWPEG